MFQTYITIQVKFSSQPCEVDLILLFPPVDLVQPGHQTAGRCVRMKALGSRCTFSLGFLVGVCSFYFFLHQVWFERSYPVLTETQEKARSTDWKKDGAALLNLLHPHHSGAVHSCILKLVQ